MSEPWRNLKIGDRVRVVAWPAELDEGCLHEETREFYEWLIATGSLLEIVEIDDWTPVRRHYQNRRRRGTLRRGGA